MIKMYVCEGLIGEKIILKSKGHYDRLVGSWKKKYEPVYVLTEPEYKRLKIDNDEMSDYIKHLEKKLREVA